MTLLPKAVQVQCDPYQITNGIFHRTRTKDFTIHMERQKTSKSQSSLTKVEWSWKNKPSWLQIILQSCSHQDSMVLAQKQKYRPTEQDRKSRNKPMHLYIPYFWQMRQEYTMEQRQTVQINGDGKTGQLHVKNETRTLPSTIHKDRLKNGLKT